MRARSYKNKCKHCTRKRAFNHANHETGVVEPLCHFHYWLQEPRNVWFRIAFGNTWLSEGEALLFLVKVSQMSGSDVLALTPNSKGVVSAVREPASSFKSGLQVLQEKWGEV